jgi:hypothetical protein
MEGSRSRESLSYTVTQERHSVITVFVRFFTGSYPEPVKSNPHHKIVFLKVPFLYYLHTYDLVVLVVSSFWLSHQNSI